nr:hypothetical protein [Tanacetum cinerariifolium]
SLVPCDVMPFESLFGRPMGFRSFFILENLSDVAEASPLLDKMKVLAEWGDAGKTLEQMREIVACDSVTLGDLEKLLARALVAVSLKEGYVSDMELKE